MDTIYLRREISDRPQSADKGGMDIAAYLSADCEGGVLDFWNGSNLHAPHSRAKKLSLPHGDYRVKWVKA